MKSKERDGKESWKKQYREKVSLTRDFFFFCFFPDIVTHAHVLLVQQYQVTYHPPPLPPTVIEPCGGGKGHFGLQSRYRQLCSKGVLEQVQSACHINGFSSSETRKSSSRGSLASMAHSFFKESRACLCFALSNAVPCISVHKSTDNWSYCVFTK